MATGYELEVEGTRDQIELAVRYARVAQVFANTDPQTVGRGAAAAGVMGSKLKDVLGEPTPLAALQEARRVSAAFSVMLKAGCLRRADGAIDEFLGDVVCLHLVIVGFCGALSREPAHVVAGGRLAEPN